jgi:hypothetical protein
MRSGSADAPPPTTAEVAWARTHGLSGGKSLVVAAQGDSDAGGEGSASYLGEFDDLRLQRDGVDGRQERVGSDVARVGVLRGGVRQLDSAEDAGHDGVLGELFSHFDKSTRSGSRTTSFTITVVARLVSGAPSVYNDVGESTGRRSSTIEGSRHIGAA